MTKGAKIFNDVEVLMALTVIHHVLESTTDGNVALEALLTDDDRGIIDAWTQTTTKTAGEILKEAAFIVKSKVEQVKEEQDAVQ